MHPTWKKIFAEYQWRAKEASWLQGEARLSGNANPGTLPLPGFTLCQVQLFILEAEGFNIWQHSAQRIQKMQSMNPNILVAT
jgi:hypothetical protein